MPERQRSDSLTRTTKASQLLLPAALLAFGLLSIALLSVAARHYLESVRQGTSRTLALGQIEADIAIVHLWVEEYVSGDQVDLTEIDERLRRASRLALALIERVLPDEDAPIIAAGLEPLPADEPELRRESEQLRTGLDAFSQISEDRLLGYDRGLAVGIGSTLDVEYDRVFGRLLGHVEVLEAALRQRQLDGDLQARQVLIGLLFSWALLVLLASLALYRYEQRRRRNEEALATSRAQLHRAQKLDAAGRLAGGLAHDVNNYLAAIRSQSELVQRDARVGSGLARRMTAVIQTVSKATALLDRLSSFSRQRPVELQAVDLNRTLTSVGGVVGPSLGEDVEVEMELADGLWPIEADSAQLEQVIVNLLVNAGDAMASGGRIEVHTSNLPATAGGGSPLGDRVALSVIDSGPGIAAEAIEHVFEPFWSTKGDRGSGLGLSIVLAAMHQCGGQVDVANRDQGGARFDLYWPRGQRLPSPVSSNAEAAELLGGDECLLLVDDHEEYREATAALLETLGYDVIACASPGEAFECFTTGDRIDLVVTDVVMPGGHGPELVTRMRGHRPDLRAIYLSAHAGAELERRGLAPTDIVVAKQSAGRELLITIRQQLDARAAPP